MDWLKAGSNLSANASLLLTNPNHGHHHPVYWSSFGSLFFMNINRQHNVLCNKWPSEQFDVQPFGSISFSPTDDDYVRILLAVLKEDTSLVSCFLSFGFTSSFSFGWFPFVHHTDFYVFYHPIHFSFCCSLPPTPSIHPLFSSLLQSHHLHFIRSDFLTIFPPSPHRHHHHHLLVSK